MDKLLIGHKLELSEIKDLKRDIKEIQAIIIPKIIKTPELVGQTIGWIRENDFLNHTDQRIKSKEGWFFPIELFDVFEKVNETIINNSKIVENLIDNFINDWTNLLKRNPKLRQKIKNAIENMEFTEKTTGGAY